MTTGILGGTFDPPHDGHLALARGALERLPIDRLVALVVANPGHRAVFASAQDRLRLARAAFEGLPAEVVLDDNAYTVDAVRDGRFGDALFIVGADEGAAFPTWKEPEEVLRWVRLAVGTRSGFAPADLSRYGERIVSFELDSPSVSSTEVRELAARGNPLAGVVPPAVEAAIRETGLYRGYTTNEPEDRKSH